MPTTRPRLTVTETDHLKRALDEAARHWPEEGGSRSRLLLKLLDEGYQAILAGRQRRATDQRRAVRDTSGALTDLYPADYLRRLRDDWPA